jgi:hypothetical protein
MSELHEAVRRYGRRALILHPRSKRPIGTGWQHGQSTATRDLLLDRHPDANVGVRCGDGLAVLDVDAHTGGHATLARLEREHGPLPDTYRVLTGGGGVHHYFQSRDRHLATVYVPDGLEIRARGAQVVAPPSVHPCGRVYVDDPSAASFGTFATLPTWLERHGGGHTRPAQQRSEPADGDVFETMTPRRYAHLLAGASAGVDGLILCPSPLHRPERTPSLKLYDTAAAGWTCWRSCCIRDGRRAGGRIWDFAAHALGFTGELRGTDFLAVREITERKIAAALGVEL